MHSSPIMDSHEPVLQFAHSLNRVLQSYGMEIQSIEFYYTDSNFLEIIRSELERLLAEPMDQQARDAIIFAIDNLPRIHDLSASQGAYHPATFSQVENLRKKMDGFQAPARSDALIGISSNVYFVDFRGGRR